MTRLEEWLNAPVDAYAVIIAVMLIIIGVLAGLVIAI